MGWLRNDGIRLHTLVQRYYSTASMKVSQTLYRSRTDIDPCVFKYMNMAFQLPNLDPEEINRYMHVITLATPRGLEDDAAIHVIKEQLYNATLGRPAHTRQLVFYNTASNQAIMPGVITALEDIGFVQKDFRTAITCTPFHVNYVLHRAYCTVVFSNVYSDEVLLKIGAILPVIYEQAVPEELLNAYISCDKQQFNTVYYALVKDVEEQRQQQEMLNKLSSLEEIIISGETRVIEESIANVRSTLEDYNIALRNKAAELQELLIRQSSPLWATQENTVREFTNYIKEHDLTNITKLDVNTGHRYLTVCIITPLLYWEDNFFKRYDEASTRNCVTGCDNNKRALLRNIFLDKTVGVTFHTGVTINFNTHQIERAPNILMYGDSPIGIPHSHVHHHNCWGDNRPLIIKAFERADYIVMWEQMKAALSGLNIADSTVFQKFVRDLNIDCSSSCLVLKDTGKTMTVAEFLNRFPDGYTPAETTPTTAQRVRRENTPVVEEVEHEETEETEDEVWEVF